MGWPTAHDVINAAAIELGIASSADVGDPYGSSDSNLIQLTALLTRAGRELCNEHDWSHLRRDYSFLTSQAWPNYLLPLDFRDMVDQSAWNRTTRMPLGPLSEQEWQFLSSRLTGVVFNVLFRPRMGLLSLYPQSGITTGQQINFTYLSSWWVYNTDAAKQPTPWTVNTDFKFGQLMILEPANTVTPLLKMLYRCTVPGKSNFVGPYKAGATTPTVDDSPIPDLYSSNGLTWNFCGYTTQTAAGVNFIIGTGDAPTGQNDTVFFDPLLMVAKLRLLWLQAKGFDSTQAERDYARTFEQIVGNDVASPKLSLVSTGATVDALIGGQNIPITGYGA